MRTRVSSRVGAPPCSSLYMTASASAPRSLPSAASSSTPASLRDAYLALREFRLLRASAAHLGGVYVLPARNRPLQWEGVLFVRQGIFSGEAFPFRVTLRSEHAPQIVLTRRVFHPLVCPRSGAFCLALRFPSWGSGDCVAFALAYLKQSFYLRSSERTLAALLAEDAALPASAGNDERCDCCGGRTACSPGTLAPCWLSPGSRGNAGAPRQCGVESGR